MLILKINCISKYKPKDCIQVIVGRLNTAGITQFHNNHPIVLQIAATIINVNTTPKQLPKISIRLFFMLL